MNRGIEDLYIEEEERLAATHRERQNAATIAQRRHESNTGKSAAPVPFQVPIP